MMDIVEFAEKFYDVKLTDWQKEHIRILERLPRGARLVMGRNGRVYIYVDQPTKELIPYGQTNDCKQ